MKLLIPQCLLGRIDEEAIAACIKWLDTFPKPDDEPECCCGSGHTFHCMGSGIGDSIWIEHGGRKFYLSRDDDNQIMGEFRF
jgi:hypothetical protein